MTFTRRQLDDAGFAVLPAIFSEQQVDAIAGELQQALANDATGSTLRTADGAIYGAEICCTFGPRSPKSGRGHSS